MPLKILYIFLCLASVHRSLGIGLDDADLNIVQSLINQTGLPSIPETSPDKLNSEYERNGNDECEKAVTLKRTLKLLMSLLSDSTSTNSKTTDVLENLKDLLKNTPAGDAEVIDKIDDLVRTLEKYKGPGDRNGHIALRSLTANPKKDGLYLDSSLKLDLKIPALANIYCTQQLLNILKATEQAYQNLARNPVCDIDVSDLSTIPHINSYLINPNLPIDDWDKSSNTIPNSQNCEKCYPTRPDKNIMAPYYYPVFIDVNPDKNSPTPYENPKDYDQVQSNIVQPNINPGYYNLIESGRVRPIEVNPVSPNYYPYSSSQVLTVDVSPNPYKNPLLQDYNPNRPGPNYYPGLFDVKPEENPLLQDYNAHGPGPKYYPDLFDLKSDENPLLQDYNAHGPGPNYYPDLFDVNPEKNPLLQDYNAHGPGPNYYPDLFDVNPEKNPLLQDYNAHGPGPNYYPDLFDVNPEKNPLLQDYNAHGPGPNYYPDLFDVKPDENLLHGYSPYYGPSQFQLVDLNPDKNPGSNYYYPEIFDVNSEKKPLSPVYNLYGPGEVFPAKTTVTPYYHPEYVDVNLDKNPYYTPDSIPHGPVNTWDKNPFPYDAAPDTLPLNSIFPYVPKIPGYPNPISENENILPFEITPEAVKFVYPNLYNFLNQSEPFDISKNIIEPNVPIYQYPIKEMKPLNPSSIISEYPENNYGVYPHIANNVQPPINYVVPSASEIPLTYTNTEPMYPVPWNNIPVNAWETSPDQNQNILDYSIDNHKIQSNYPIEISSLDLNFLPNDISKYNIQSNNQYHSYDHFYPYKHDVSPFNPYNPSVPDQFKPQQPLSNPGPLINVVPTPNEIKPPLKMIGLVREAIDVIQAIVPVVKFDRPTLHIIAKIKSILVRKDEDISHEQYSTILHLFGKLIEYVKQLEYYKQIKDIIDSHAVSNRQKLETEKIVELTYLLKHPKPVVYYPYYYVKYSMPYRNFMMVANKLLRQKPELKDKPNELYEEVLALSNVVDLSPDLKKYNKEDLLKLTANAGSLVDTKFIEEHDSLREQLNMLKHITSDLTTDEILDLKKSNSKYQQLADTESDNQASLEPFVLRDKKEADPNIIIGMQRLNDIFNTPNFHSSTFNSDKLREDLLRGGKDIVNVQLRNAINNRDDNYPPDNNWIQKLFEATKEASHSPHVMSSNGLVRIDNQKITINSGSGNRQDAVSIFNPESKLKLASSNSKDVGINVESNPSDANKFLKRYNGPNIINYDNQKITVNSGDSHNQSYINITNPKFMLNALNEQESYADDLESTTEQDGLAIESNQPLKWEQRDTTYTPIPRPGSTKNYQMNNMAGSNQDVVTIPRPYDEQHLVMPKQSTSSYGNNILHYGMKKYPHQIEVVNSNEPLSISNDPAAIPGSVAYYGIPNKVGIKNNEGHLSISNDPKAVPGSVTYYKIKGMEMPNPVGEINNEEHLLISNKPTSVPGSVSYYGINGVAIPNEAQVIKNEEQLSISNEPTAVPAGLLYYGMNSMAANQGGVLGTQNTILHQEAEQVFPYELEHIVDKPDNNGLNGESIKESVFEDIQLTEKMKYKGNKSVGGGQGVINNVLQTITGNDHVLQYTVDSQEQLILDNKLYGAEANQEMIEQQNLANNYNSMVGQNNNENYLYDVQHDLGNMGPYSTLGDAQNIQSSMVHHIGSPYSASYNVAGYGPGVNMLGQKLVIHSIYKRPFSYHQRITARRPVVVG